MPTIKKRLKLDNHISTEGILWVDKYRPKTTADLAVHSKKVQEVISWLDCAKGADILLLTGPPGCGKSACMYAIPRLSISCWKSGDMDNFKEFLLRASRYSGVEDIVDQDLNRIVLLENVPNQAYEDPSSLQAALASYRLLGRRPLVLVLSDSTIMKFSVTRLLSQAALDSLGIRTVAFNPIADTLMKKALSAIVEREVPRGRAAASQTLADVLASSGGDIRAAINSLQMLLTPSARGVPVSGSAPGCKDERLSLFRALGRVLYCKRETAEAAVEAHHARLALTRPTAQDKMRAPLLVCPETVFADSGLDASTFADFLSENVADLIGDVDQLSAVLDSLSSCDLLLTRWEVSPDARGLSGRLCASLAARAVAFHDRGRPPATFRPLRRSGRMEAVARAASLRRDVREAAVDGLEALLGPGDALGWREALLDRLPSRVPALSSRLPPGGFLRDLLGRVCSYGTVPGRQGRGGEACLGGPRPAAPRGLPSWAVCPSLDNEDAAIIDDDEE